MALPKTVAFPILLLGIAAVGSLLLFLHWHSLSPNVFQGPEPLLDSGGREFFRMKENERRVWERFPHLSCTHPATATQPFAFIGGTNFCNVQHRTGDFHPDNTAMTISDPATNRTMQLHIPIPLTELEELRSFARQSTVGRGDVDELNLLVRRCVEISASQIASPSWTITHGEWRILQQILANIMKQQSMLESATGGEDYHELRLHKMLLYQPGDFFLSHTDSYKEEGMFATVIVQLPVDSSATGPLFEGGTLRISRTTLSPKETTSGLIVNWHPSETASWKINRKCSWDEQFSDLPVLHYVAFYSDCKHELQPITAGHRVTLVYNLIRKPGTGP